MRFKSARLLAASGVESGRATLASKDALDANDVSASISLHSSNVLALTVIHNYRMYAARVRVPENLAKRLALVISGASPSKSLREIGELEIQSEVPQ